MQRHLFEVTRVEHKTARLMETTNRIDSEIPPMKKGQLNVYKPSDIKRWGVERFLEATSVNDPFLLEFPEFTEEENKRMDELLAEGDRGAV